MKNIASEIWQSGVLSKESVNSKSIPEKKEKLHTKEIYSTTIQNIYRQENSTKLMEFILFTQIY